MLYGKHHMFPHTIVSKTWCCGMDGCKKQIPVEKKSLIVYHKNTHNPKYECTHCGEKFPQKNRLEVHVRTAHTFEKPYKCSHCDRAFPQLSNLNDHVKNNHMGVSSGCDEHNTPPIPRENPGTEFTGIPAS